MKNLIIISLGVFINIIAHGQSKNDLFFIGTADTSNEQTHFNKDILEWSDSSDVTPTIFYSISYCVENFEIMFMSVDRQDLRREIVDWPISMLDSIESIDVEQFVATHTKAQASDWYRKNKHFNGRAIWIIDRNDFYKSSPSLTEPDRMRLICVTMSTSDMLLDEPVGFIPFGARRVFRLLDTDFEFWHVEKVGSVLANEPYYFPSEYIVTAGPKEWAFATGFYMDRELQSSYYYEPTMIGVTAPGHTYKYYFCQFSGLYKLQFPLTKLQNTPFAQYRSNDYFAEIPLDDNNHCKAIISMTEANQLIIIIATPYKTALIYDKQGEIKNIDFSNRNFSIILDVGVGDNERLERTYMHGGEILIDDSI